MKTDKKTYIVCLFRPDFFKYKDISKAFKDLPIIAIVCLGVPVMQFIDTLVPVELEVSQEIKHIWCFKFGKYPKGSL